MRKTGLAAIVLALAVSGCVATPVSSAIIIGIMGNDVARYYGEDTDPMGRRRPPEPDPTRKIDEQDCTKPMVFDGGNLRCK